MRTTAVSVIGICLLTRASGSTQGNISTSQTGHEVDQTPRCMAAMDRYSHLLTLERFQEALKALPADHRATILSWGSFFRGMFQKFTPMNDCQATYCEFAFELALQYVVSPSDEHIQKGLEFYSKVHTGVLPSFSHRICRLIPFPKVKQEASLGFKILWEPSEQKKRCDDAMIHYHNWKALHRTSGKVDSNFLDRHEAVIDRFSNKDGMTPCEAASCELAYTLLEQYIRNPTEPALQNGLEIMTEEIQSGACLYIPRMQVRTAVMKIFQPPFPVFAQLAPERTNTDLIRCKNSKNQYDIDLRYLQTKSKSQGPLSPHVLFWGEYFSQVFASISAFDICTAVTCELAFQLATQLLLRPTDPTVMDDLEAVAAELELNRRTPPGELYKCSLRTVRAGYENMGSMRDRIEKRADARKTGMLVNVMPGRLDECEQAVVDFETVRASQIAALRQQPEQTVQYVVYWPRYFKQYFLHHPEQMGTCEESLCHVAFMLSSRIAQTPTDPTIQGALETLYAKVETDRTTESHSCDPTMAESIKNLVESQR